MGVFGDIMHNLPALPKRSETQSTNPITLMRSLSLVQWLLFLSGWLAWTCDAIDFFAVSLSVVRLEEAFKQSAHAVTTSITLTLLFRPLGAVIFGLVSDRYGRKWPLVANLVIVAVLSLATGFVKDFSAFLAVRSLFGIAMGGIWGQAAGTALENMPVEARGLFSGILQQGYAVGYLIAAVINLYVVPRYKTWRVLFYVAAGISLGAAFIRAALPESQFFIDRREAAARNGEGTSSGEKSKQFVREMGKALKTHWVRCIFAIFLMSGFNFYSHGSQDLFPTYLQKGKGLTAHNATVGTIIGNCGAIVGGTISGYASQYLGRRLTIILCCIWTCIWLPLWYLPTKFGPLAAGAFFVQSGVQGAWGVIPIYLTEISPVAFRAVWPGVAYQLGNMVSSASAQIEATAGAKILTKKGLPNYGKVSVILIGVVSGFIIIMTILGREAHSAHFENGKAAFEKDAGLDEHGVMSSPESDFDEEKRQESHH
ncbi:MFS transporter, SHS family, lactate transporter, partial [Phenoliferia sp. Uapishka_3]